MPRIRESPQRAPTERADPCHKAPFRASAPGGRKASKTAPSGGTDGLFQPDPLRPDPVPHLLARRLSGVGRAVGARIRSFRRPAARRRLLRQSRWVV
jgi:hypothetical protein